MKDVNCIQTRSPRELRAIRRWQLFTVFSCILVGLGILLAHIPQWYTWKFLNKTLAHKCCISPSADLTQQIQSLQNKQKQLHACITKGNRYCTNLRLWRERLEHVTTACPNLESALFAKSDIKLTVPCATIEQTKKISQKLTSLPCIQTIRLTTLQPSPNGFACQIICKV